MMATKSKKAPAGKKADAKKDAGNQFLFQKKKKK